MDADRLEQLAARGTGLRYVGRESFGLTSDALTPPDVIGRALYVVDDDSLIALAPQLARDHAALLRWADKAARSLADLYIALELWQEGRTLNRPYVRLRIGEAKELLAALDGLLTGPAVPNTTKSNQEDV